jgi:hypothetical protein
LAAASRDAGLTRHNHLEVRDMKAFLGGFMVAGLLVSRAFAQSSAGTWNDLTDRFQIDTG